MTKNSLNVLFISNSTCYYFTDALYAMLAEAGYDYANLCLVYSDGCSLEKHYNWWMQDEAPYSYYVTNKDGRNKTPNCSLEQALKTYDWDIINFDNNLRSFTSGDVETSVANAEPYMENMYTELKNRFPNAKFLWHETWACGVGYTLGIPCETKEYRDLIQVTMRGASKSMVSTYDVRIVPTGEAWAMVRDLPIIRKPIEGLGVEEFTLTTRISKGIIYDDYTHDGDIGGGQYLNACVWYEILTGLDCRQNPFRPKYSFEGIDCSLSEEKIQILQNAAHKAVQEWV